MFEYIGPPLTRESLAAVLVTEGVAERAYSLYGSHKEYATVLDNRAGNWVVFYCERGEELGLRMHPNEADACEDLLCRVLGDEHNRFDLVAGPALPGEADNAFHEWLNEHGIDQAGLPPGDWKVQDSPWKVGEPDYRRYWVRIKRTRRGPG